MRKFLIRNKTTA